MKRILVTSGDPSGVGPELCLRLLRAPAPCQLTVIADRDLLLSRAQQLGQSLEVADYETTPDAPRSIWHHPLTAAVKVGELSTDHAHSVLQQLEQAASACLSGQFHSLLTAPISKQNILAAGYSFVGQTEFLAEKTASENFMMLLSSPRLRIGLLTTHVPLKDVPGLLNTEMIVSRLRLLQTTLPRCFNFEHSPDIRVCGLNPHAGEGGYLGEEDQAIIAPAVARAQREGIRAQGPLSADTAILQAFESGADCVLAMYHDQGLPAIKLLDFAHTINITLGLPFLRASPDHGVALDIAGTDRVCSQSTFSALDFLCNASH